MSKPVEKEPCSKYSVVRIFCKLLNLTDEGKADSFVDKTIKFLKGNIQKGQHNIERHKLIFEEKKLELEDKIADAKADAISSLSQFDPERIQTNADQRDYIDEYLNNIEFAEDRVLALTDELEKLTKDHHDAVAELEERISLIKRRIQQLSAN